MYQAECSGTWPNYLKFPPKKNMKSYCSYFMHEKTEVEEVCDLPKVNGRAEVKPSSSTLESVFLTTRKFPTAVVNHNLVA